MRRVGSLDAELDDRRGCVQALGYVSRGGMPSHIAAESRAPHRQDPSVVAGSSGLGTARRSSIAYLSRTVSLCRPDRSPGIANIGRAGRCRARTTANERGPTPVKPGTFDRVTGPPDIGPYRGEVSLTCADVYCVEATSEVTCRLLWS